MCPKSDLYRLTNRYRSTFGDPAVARIFLGPVYGRNLPKDTSGSVPENSKCGEITMHQLDVYSTSMAVKND